MILAENARHKCLTPQPSPGWQHPGWNSVHCTRVLKYSNTLPLFSREYIYSGYVLEPMPKKIDTGAEETGAFKDYSGSGWGTGGVFTYNMHNKRTNKMLTIAVMFSIPRNYAQYSNTVSLGIFEKNVNCDDDLFNSMYYNQGNDWITKAAADSNGMGFRRYGVTISGDMTNKIESVLKVSLEA